MAMRRWKVDSKWLVWILTAACIDTPSARDVAEPERAATPTAAELVSEMAAAYASTSSYEDRGEVTTAFSGQHSSTTKLAFTTGFARGRRFRFEYTKDHEFQGHVLGSQHLVIWSDFSHTYTEWSIKPGIVDDGPDLAMALGAAAGISGGSSIMVAPFLLPELLGRGLRPRKATIDGTEVIDGHSCWRIKGSNEQGDPLTLWIDQGAHLLRRLEQSHHFADFDTDEVISFQPVVNAAIAESRLQPPDLTAQPPAPRPPLPPPAWAGLMFEDATTKVRLAVPGGPADRAGVHAGDEIVAFDGRHLNGSAELVGDIYRAGVGTRVTLSVLRAGAPLDIALVLEQRPKLDAVARDKLLDKAAPTFDLPVVSGSGSASLTQLAGRVVILDFWSSSCEPCSRQVPHLNELARRYPTLDVIGVSSDEPAEAREFAQDNRVAYRLAQDRDDKLATAYLCTAHPMLVVIDKAGIVRAVQIGAGDTSELDATVAKLVQ